jgi:hypothetical protein
MGEGTLSGQVALVTGGTRGLGKAFVRALAAAEEGPPPSEPVGDSRQQRGTHGRADDRYFGIRTGRISTPPVGADASGMSAASRAASSRFGASRR